MTTNPSTPLRCVAASAMTSLTLIMNADAACDKMLSDFQASTNSLFWQIVNDDVMCGFSTGQFQLLTNGAGFSGGVSLETFAEMRSSR